MTESKNRESLLLPVLIPVGSLVLIVSVLFLLSRVLLNVSHTAATVTALVVATGIMVMAAAAAGRKQVDAGAMVPLFGGVLGVAMLAGGGALLLGPPHEEEGGEPVVVAIAAPVNATVDGFSTDALRAPADAAFTLAFDNQDTGVLHNVLIATADPATGGEVLNTAELIIGPAMADYPIEALAAGEYFFFCEVHPTTMTGTLTVAEGPVPGGDGGAVVVAKDVAFDTDTIELPADQESSLTLDNQDDGVPHNIAIYTDESLAENLFKGEIFSGVAQQTYAVPALAAGEYYFHCDVHPNMAGTVIVGGEGGGLAEPEPTAEPTPEPTAEPTTSPPDTGSPPGTGEVAAVVVAKDNLFDVATIQLPAGVPTVVTLDNQDGGIPHNIAIYTDESASEAIVIGELFTGVASKDLEIPALEPGEYFFRCDVHPATMVGTVSVA